jgi:serine/threonine-protein kinase RsbW
VGRRSELTRPDPTAGPTSPDHASTGGDVFGLALVAIGTHDLCVSTCHPGAAVVELRIAAQTALTFTARTVASQVAQQADFDLDATSDFRMAVDEMCNTLIPLTSTGSVLTCTFVPLADRIHIAATVAPDPSDARIDTQSWGWRILQTLLDEVTVNSLETDEGVRHLQIRATKLAVPDIDG